MAMAAWCPSGSRTMRSGSSPRRSRMISTFWPRSGWCGWVMVTNPKGGWDEGVVCLGHAAPQRALLAIRFRDEHATHGVRSIRSLLEFDRQFVEPPVSPVLLDV